MKQQAPILTKLIVRTPALCLDTDRSFPKHVPRSAAYKSRIISRISVAADTGQERIVMGAPPPACDIVVAAIAVVVAVVIAASDADATPGYKKSSGEVAIRIMNFLRSKLLCQNFIARDCSLNSSSSVDLFWRSLWTCWTFLANQVFVYIRDRIGPTTTCLLLWSSDDNIEYNDDDDTVIDCLQRT